MGKLIILRQALNPLPPKMNGGFPIKALCLCTMYHLKVTDQLIKELTLTAMKAVDILREMLQNAKMNHFRNVSTF